MSQIFWCFSICVCCFCFHFPWFHDVCSIVFLNNCLASFLHLKFKFDLYNSGATKTNNPWKRNEKETRCLQSGMVEGCVWRNSGQTDACDVGTSIGSSNYAATRKICSFFSLPSFKTNIWHWKISHSNNFKMVGILQLVAMFPQFWRLLGSTMNEERPNPAGDLDVDIPGMDGWMDGTILPVWIPLNDWDPHFLGGIKLDSQMDWSILDRFRLFLMAVI